MLDILRLLKEAKSANVRKLDIRKDGSISVEFAEIERLEKLSSEATKEEMEEMEKISKEVTEEEENRLTDEIIAELELNNPQEIDSLIELGKIIETDSGELIPA